jgi:class 3 adenylate cyclase/predicted ATPase
MTFEELLDQAIAMLQRHGRVAYRTFKRQFELDDVALDDLKEALLFTYPQVVDEAGRGLVWPTTPADQPAPVAPPPATSQPPDAERRQLTVMFCDLADSTRLASQLDPEDLREVIRAYQEASAGVIQRFEGYIAQYLGDGLLVYVGFPQAHEDDAQRAVRAALGILEAMGTLNARLERDKGVRLTVRIGIHTGPVVVGEMGGGGRHEQLALGETPNIAARIQGIATPNTVAISDATLRLVEGYFAYEDLGMHTLKGVGTPLRVSLIAGESGAQTRLEVVTTRGLTPLVGREHEVEMLLARWAQAREGRGADGVPLYIEEMTKATLESGLLRDINGRYELVGSFSSLAIPTTLQDSLMARLDRLGPAKGVAQIGATIGRQFSHELLQAVSSLDEETLQRELGQLVDAELVYQRGIPPRATYMFKHALIQDAAYQSLLRSTRQQYHQRIASVLETQFSNIAATQPALLAHHYTEAGLTEQAIPYWQRAGQYASDRSAHVEAISHLSTGIELLKTLPETPGRTQHALPLHIALGVALLMTKGPGAPEVEHAYTQAYALCQQMGETPELAPVLLGLWRFYLARPQLHTTREIGETLLRLVQRVHDPVLAVIAHYTLGATWMWLGALPVARQHLEAGIALYTPDQRRARVFRIGQDPGVACRVLAAQILWLLGYPEQALARIHEALALAHELSHPYSLTFARLWAAIVSQLRRDVPAVHEQAEATVALSTEQGFTHWAAWGTSLRGWTLAMQGQGEAGIVQVRQGIAAWRATGGALGVPYFCTVLAEVADHLGHTEDGLQALAEAHTLVEQQEERWWEAEVSRLRGVLLLRQPGTPQAEAEAWLQRALDVARRQEVKSLELRAAMSLARLWQQQEKCDAARELLAPIYGWFTEGFDTADLQEAGALLETLGV